MQSTEMAIDARAVAVSRPENRKASSLDEAEKQKLAAATVTEVDVSRGHVLTGQLPDQQLAANSSTQPANSRPLRSDNFRALSFVLVSCISACALTL
jgi:hypothetical protein